MNAPGVWLLAMAAALTGPLEAVDLADATSSLFSGSANCAFCHESLGGALTDRKGRDVSITTDWRGTMMAHSFKDPLWRAVMETEVRERPHLKAFIEDKCMTCHAPMARTQHRADHGTTYAYTQALKDPLAGDGVSCSLCHQMQPEGLGQPKSFTGSYVINDSRQIFGPYHDVVTMPMQHHVQYTPQFGAHVQDSALCATCHTLYTPILNQDGMPTGTTFPEQTPYLEWKAGDFARSGKHCQDCHMPRLDEPIQISARPPWIGTRQPFWRHEFVGGNAFMLRLMADHAEIIHPNADPDTLARTALRAEDQLKRAATLDVLGQLQGDRLELRVTVSNQTGHKFPTGHPYRRAWLQVRIEDGGGRELFASGTSGPAGRLTESSLGFHPHADLITRPDEVQVYESVMGDRDGHRTYALLSADHYLKDNRIPPRGFVADTPDIEVRGQAASDPNFHLNRAGTDQVTYRVTIGKAKGPFKIEVNLLYQPVPPEAVDRLSRSTGEEARTFTRLYQQADKSPMIVQARQLVLE